jgi:hypothetical protein
MYNKINNNNNNNSDKLLQNINIRKFAYLKLSSDRSRQHLPNVRIYRKTEIIPAVVCTTLVSRYQPMLHSYVHLYNDR